jgi:predicted metal-dependent hydrolase
MESHNIKIIRTKRKKTVAISIDVSGQVIIKTPKHTTEEEIKKIIEIKKDWISKKIQSQEKLRLIAKSNKNKVLYLGKYYDLRVVPAKEDEIKLGIDNITVFNSRIENSNSTETILNFWLFNQASKIYSEFIEEGFLLINQEHDIERPQMQIKRIANKWGTCSSTKVVTINTDLIKTPLECIKYVVFHEMCHLIHMNHGSDFYKLQKQLTPDYKILKQKLEQYQFLINFQTKSGANGV